KACYIAIRNKATLNLVHVVDTRSFVSIEAYDGTIAQRAESYAKELLEEYKGTATNLGVENLNAIVEHGSPKTIIPKKTAKAVNADLIICGATGLNAVERLLIGSVSEHIMRSAECDVLVVRTDDDVTL